MNKSRPLARWTIGPTLNDGFACLAKSVRQFANIYPEFDLLIAHNQLTNDKIKVIESLGVETCDQMHFVSSLDPMPVNGYNVHWKLYPPRFRTNAHEIVIDNDIIIRKRIREIDLFLESDSVLLYQGLNGQHGIYEDLVPTGMRVNSGIYGMPAGYDFLKEIHRVVGTVRNWNGKFDEQGLVAATLSAYHTHYIIPLTTLPIVESHFDLKALTNPLCCGHHFVGINYNENHMAWNAYNNFITLI